jgi:hypothetical protein
MKNIFRILSAVIFLAVSGILLCSCEITNPAEHLALVMSTVARETSVAVNISDQSSINVSSPVLVTFSGKDSALVINEVNKALSSITISAGNLTFSIKDGTAISASNPVTLVLNLHSVNKDFLDIAYPLTITKTGFQQVGLKMAKLSDVSSTGIEVVTNAATSGTASNGTVTSAINYTTSAGTNVNIPVGAILKDASGTPLSGQLSVSVTTFSDQAYNMIPIQTYTSGQTIYHSVGAFTCKIADQNGRVAQSYTGTSPRIFIPLDAAALNPATGIPFAIGDTIWFYGMDANGNTSLIEQEVVGTNTSSAKTGYKSVNSKFGQSIGATFTNGANLNPTAGSGAIAIGVPVPVAGATEKKYTFNFGKNFNELNVSLKLSMAITATCKLEYVLKSDSIQTFTVDYEKMEGYNAMVKIDGSPIAVSDTISSPVAGGTINYLPVKLGHYFDVFVQGKCPNEDPSNPQRINPNISLSYLKSSTLPYALSNPKSYGTWQLKDGHGKIWLDDGNYMVSTRYNNTDYSTIFTVENGSISITNSSNMEAMPNTPAATNSVSYLWFYMITKDACN